MSLRLVGALLGSCLIISKPRMNNGGKGSHKVRLYEKTVNPENQLKMSVPLAKMIILEHETVEYGTDFVCEKLGINAGEPRVYVLPEFFQNSICSINFHRFPQGPRFL